MSQQGIRIAANVFSAMQQAQYELMKLGTADIQSDSGKVDILLSRLLALANDAVKTQFASLVMVEKQGIPYETIERFETAIRNATGVIA